MLVNAGATAISVLALDVDRVLPWESPIPDIDGKPASVFGRDLDALTKLRDAGFRVALLTGAEGPQVAALAARIGADAVVSGAKDKTLGLSQLCAALGVELASVCYVGDLDGGVVEFPVVGLTLTPADTSSRSRAQASRVLTTESRSGSVASAVDVLLGLRNLPAANALQVSRATTIFQESVTAHQHMLERGAETIVKMAMIVSNTFRNGGKVLFLGNGGSAADAQHAAAELMGRFNYNRPPLPALSLATDTSVLTCVANDWDYSEVFVRQVEGLARPGDVVVGLSTSGRSVNVARSLKMARDKGAHALALTGGEGRIVGENADVLLDVPSLSTPRVQELHILALHTLCELVESELFPQPS